ncbi:MAG: orotate phosphoribosyltransferase [Candidatus Methanomethylicia archaeon]
MENKMDKCSICKVNNSIYVCRRCGRRICGKCMHIHGLCIECAKRIGRI